MTGTKLFRSPLHRDIWRMRWCESCFQPDEAARRLHGKDTVCPIWAKAMREDRKPPSWDRMPRATEMEHTIKCNAYTSQPPLARRLTSTQDDNVPLFDVTPYATNIGLVPVEGWPEREPKDGVDHQ